MLPIARVPAAPGLCCCHQELIMPGGTYFGPPAAAEFSRAGFMAAACARPSGVSGSPMAFSADVDSCGLKPKAFGPVMALAAGLAWTLVCCGICTGAAAPPPATAGPIGAAPAPGMYLVRFSPPEMSMVGKFGIGVPVAA